MKQFLFVLSILMSGILTAQNVPLPTGKAIYIPKDLQQMDLQNPDSKWSYHRMAHSENFAVFWERFIITSSIGGAFDEGRSTELVA